MKILEDIVAINFKNDNLAKDGKRKREKLDIKLLIKILHGITTNSVTGLAMSTGISVDIINDVIDYFELHSNTKIENLLNTIEEQKNELHELLKKKIDEKVKLVDTPVAVLKSKKTYGNVKITPEARKSFVKKQERKGLDIPSFREDMQFGLSRLLARYGEGTDYNLTDEQIKEQVLIYEPSILKRDPYFFQKIDFKYKEENE